MRRKVMYGKKEFFRSLRKRGKDNMPVFRPGNCFRSFNLRPPIALYK